MSGQAALDMFDPDEFDLVLLDIQLPDMTGLDVARAIHLRYPDAPLPPLVALTANVLKDKREYLDAGMDDVLSKPLAVPALTAMIKDTGIASQRIARRILSLAWGKGAGVTRFTDAGTVYGAGWPRVNPPKPGDI